MLNFKPLLVLFLVYSQGGWAAPSQIPIQVPEIAECTARSTGVRELTAGRGIVCRTVVHSADAKRKLQGRFLHITDMHPDPYYKLDASEKSACHRAKPKKARPRSGYYGMPYSECDSPLTLTNFTLDYLEKEWSKEIDFVVWTGDSASASEEAPTTYCWVTDADEECIFLPEVRTTKQVLELPTVSAAEHFAEFMFTMVPVLRFDCVALHDNDRKRPRTTTEIYTLNRALAERMEEAFLSKGIPVIPSIGNNDVWPHNIMLPGPNSITSEYSSIWRNFVPFESYQVFQRGGYFSVEVIPGQVAVISLNTMYFYDSNKAVGGCEEGDSADPGNLQFDWLEVQLHTFRSRGMQVWISGHVPPSADNYFPDCHVRYTELALRYQDTILGHLYGHMNADHFFFLDADYLRSKQHRNASTAASDEPQTEKHMKHRELYNELLKDYGDIPKAAHKTNYDDYGVVNVSPSIVPNPYLPSFRIFVYNVTGTPYHPAAHLDGIYCDDANKQNHWRCALSKDWHANPQSPSRTNRLWTPLGYAQFYLPKLDSANKKHAPKVKLEYVTFPVWKLHPPRRTSTEAEEAFRYPIPLRHLPKSLGNATAEESKFAPYRLADLTIGSWANLGRRLAEGSEKKLRKRFRKYMYMGGVGS